MSEARWSRILTLSLEPWDEVWRRNQHLASRLVRLGYADSLVFVEPPAGGLALKAKRSSPEPGVITVTPPLVVPRRWGGHRTLGYWLRRQLDGVDAIWVNDPVMGAELASSSVPMLYDVTDDWRSMPQSDAERQRIIAAEDVLATRAATVVCSAELAERWKSRYGIEPTVVPNGVDLAAISAAVPNPLSGRGPHAVYVGTVHPSRIDVPLLLELAERWPGTLHLVGPTELGPAVTDRLTASDAELVGRVPSSAVPPWLVAADVLVCPHLVNDFTLSLDAIKAHEYLSTTRPVVATPSSGFQDLIAPGLTVVSGRDFVDAAIAAATAGSPWERTVADDWTTRTGQLVNALAGARSTSPQTAS